MSAWQAWMMAVGITCGLVACGPESSSTTRTRTNLAPASGSGKGSLPNNKPPTPTNPPGGTPGTPQPPMPGNPTPGNPMPGNPTPGSPIPGNPMPGNPMPGNPMPGNPAPVSPMPGSPTPGNPMPGTPTPAGPMPANPTPGNPMMPAPPSPQGPVGPALPVGTMQVSLKNVGTGKCVLAYATVNFPIGEDDCDKSADQVFTLTVGANQMVTIKHSKGLCLALHQEKASDGSNQVAMTMKTCTNPEQTFTAKMFDQEKVMFKTSFGQCIGSFPMGTKAMLVQQVCINNTSQMFLLED